MIDNKEKMIKKRDKRGAEMTIGTIIIIILALVVLVFLIFAFAKSGGNIMDYINNLFGGSSNIDTIKNSCNAVCASQAQNAFCEEVRTLKVSKTEVYKGTCNSFNSLPSSGIEACPSITCTNTAVLCKKVSNAWKLEPELTADCPP